MTVLFHNHTGTHVARVNQDSLTSTSGQRKQWLLGRDGKAWGAYGQDPEKAMASHDARAVHGSLQKPLEWSTPGRLVCILESHGGRRASAKLPHMTLEHA